MVFDMYFNLKFSKGLQMLAYICLLLQAFAILPTSSSFPFSEIIPYEGKIIIYSNISKNESILEILEQPSVHFVSDVTHAIEVSVIKILIVEESRHFKIIWKFQK